MAFSTTYDGPVLSAQAATYTINPGVQIAAGSVAIAVVSVQGITETLNAPDGTWVKVEEAQATNITTTAWVKAFASAETTTYQFSNSGAVNKAYQGGIVIYSGRDTTTPVHRSAKIDGTVTAQQFIDLPALASNPTINGCDIVRIGAISGGSITIAITMPSTQRDQWQTTSGIARRPAAVSDFTQGTAAAVGADTATTDMATAGAAATASRVGITIALAPAATGWTGSTPPDAIVTLGGLTGALGDIDDDPDSPDANWLVVG
jgi:hypothetical protein